MARLTSTGDAIPKPHANSFRNVTIIPVNILPVSVRL
jgi:hypothetical protein